MRVDGKVIIVTGGANGIGRALVERFHREGAAGVIVADLDGAGAQAVAASVGGVGVACDVGREADIRALTDLALDRFGRIDLFCSNAGVGRPDPDPDIATSAPDDDWRQAWEVNVMAHVYAARAALPSMIARGGGWFLNTVSAAGLLTQVGSASYSASKHAAIGFAESLAITHRDQGIRVSVLCPQAVATAMAPAGSAPVIGAVLTPEQVAEATVLGLAEDRFLILPHPQVRDYVQRKAADHDRWIGGMAKLRRGLRAPGP